MPAVFAAVDSARLQWETRPALYATRTDKMLRTSLPTAPLSLQRGNAYFVVAMSCCVCYIPIPANSVMSSWGLRTVHSKNTSFVSCPVIVKLVHSDSYLPIILLISAPFWPNLWRSKRQRRSVVYTRWRILRLIPPPKLSVSGNLRNT